MSNLATYGATPEQGFDDLVTRHAPLVKRIAYHLMNRLPPSVQAEDLIQAGMIGLIEASRNYDPSQGASFETYAGIRIRGAMLDEIRRSDWTPRSVHRKARMVADAMREIENSEGRDARDVEVAESLGMSLEDYHHVLQDASGARIFSYEELSEVGEVVPTEGSVAPAAASPRQTTMSVSPCRAASVGGRRSCGAALRHKRFRLGSPLWPFTLPKPLDKTRSIGFFSTSPERWATRFRSHLAH